MHLKNVLLMAIGLTTSIGASAADSIQIGLPGYLKDSTPLEQTTPELVFSALRDDPNARIKETTEPGVAIVEIIDDPAGTTHVFFGKDHWAHPTVLRLRRIKEHGVWTTRTSHLCKATKRSCNDFKNKLASREAQVANIDAASLENPEIKRLQQPLPGRITPASKDFWINQFMLLPTSRERNWDQDLIMQSTEDSTCSISRPIYARPPSYPVQEQIDRTGGTTIMVMAVDGNGHVIDAIVERSSRNNNLDQAALNAASIMRFHMRDCKTPASIAYVRLPFDFIPEVNFPYVGLTEFDATSFGF